jgi:hypothetical protein
MEAKRYRVFYGGRHDLNIVGIRSVARQNRFDDMIVVFSRHDSQWLCWAFPSTTDPGAYYLERPVNKNGTAILAPGQYRSAYAIGKHRGKYDALVQIRSVTVYRDDDRDNRLDTGQVTETGLFGINIHQAMRDAEASLVDRFSAGCQVFRHSADFDIFMSMARAGAAAYGNAFTYTLLDEADLQ